MGLTWSQQPLAQGAFSGGHGGGGQRFQVPEPGTVPGLEDGGRCVQESEGDPCPIASESQGLSVGPCGDEFSNRLRESRLLKVDSFPGSPVQRLVWPTSWFWPFDTLGVHRAQPCPPGRSTYRAVSQRVGAACAHQAPVCGAAVEDECRALSSYSV